MNNGSKDIPDEILWHEGMLLAPHHFQQMALRSESLLHYHCSLLSPFHWGIRRFKFDPVLLSKGKIRLLELEALMPSGLLVRHLPGNGEDLELELPSDEGSERVLTVYLAVTAAGGDGASQQGGGRRYQNSDGQPVADESGGESRVRIPRRVPRLQLIPAEVLPSRFEGFPLMKVRLREAGFAETEFLAPHLSVSLDSPLGLACTELIRQLRSKANFLAVKANSPSMRLGLPLGLETKYTLQSLMEAVPSLEALLTSQGAHPFAVYLQLCSIAGKLAALGPRLVPPSFDPYDHNDIKAGFDQVTAFIYRMLEYIDVTYTPIPFTVEDDCFNLELPRQWLDKRLVIGVRGRSEMSERDVIEWVEGSLIGDHLNRQRMEENRVLGARRRRIDRDEGLGLVPTSGIVLFAIDPDPQFIQAERTLQIFNYSLRHENERPLEIVLYVKKSAQQAGGAGQANARRPGAKGDAKEGRKS